MKVHSLLILTKVCLASFIILIVDEKDCLVRAKTTRYSTNAFQPIHWQKQQKKQYHPILKRNPYTRFSSKQLTFVQTTNKNYFHLHGIQKTRKNNFCSHSSLVPLQMISSASSSSSSSSIKTQVIMQKVIRSVPIPILIEYLRDIYRIPSDLSMPYETVSSSSSPSSKFLQQLKERSNKSHEGGTIVTAFQSPLADNDNNNEPNETLLWVELLGVYVGGGGGGGGDGDNTGNDNGSSTTPQMAMLVIKKIQPSSSIDSISTSPMMGLYQDSEQKLIRSLERGLDDLADGKRGYYNQDEIDQLNQQHQKQMEEKTISNNNNPVENDIKPIKSKEVNISSDSMKTSPPPPPPPPSSSSSKKQMKTKNKVKFVKNIRSLDIQIPEPKNDNYGNPVTQTPRNDYRTNQIIDVESSNIDTTLDPTNKPSKDTNIDNSDNNNNNDDDTEQFLKKEEERQRQLDSLFSNAMDDSPLEQPPEQQMQQTQEQNNQGITKEELEEIMGGGMDVSPEELLQNVLDFDKRQSKEEKIGHGFVTGAFEKAKQLLRQQKSTTSNQDNSAATTPKTQMQATATTSTMGQQQKQQKQRDQVTFQETKRDGKISDFLNIPNDDENIQKNENEEIDEQEELRRIFEAGKRVAEGRIVNGFDSSYNQVNANANANAVTDNYIDELIGSDQTVPRVSSSSIPKQMDEELAELEIRINRNPGEEAPSGPVFDIFSGPSTSSLSSEEDDPTMATNWPGAPSGAKAVHNLPSDLKDAIKYAKFAADTLGKITQDKDEFYLGEKIIPRRQVELLEKCVQEAVQAGFIDIHPLDEMAERAQLTMLLKELSTQPIDDEDRFQDIIQVYNELFLSDRFVSLIKERLTLMANREQERRQKGIEEGSAEDRADINERVYLSKLTQYSMRLLKETQALGAELEVSQLEIIRSICQVAMDPKYTTEEEAAVALTDMVRGMRPLLDDSFVAYLKYAIAEEEGRLTRRGLLEDPEHNSWLFVLKIVQEGVYAELGRELSRYIDHIGYILRMKTKKERKQLLIKLVDVMPSMDVRPFVKIVDNIVASLGTSANGDFSDAVILGGMTNEILQLSADLKDVLPPERIQLMSRDADEWSARQRKKMKEQREETRNRIIAERQQRALIDGAIGKSTGNTRGNIEKLP